MTEPRLMQTPLERENDITRTLVRLADTLVGPYDEIALLQDLADSCVRILHRDFAGISLAAGRRPEFVVATSEAVEMIALHQADLEHGPGNEAFATGSTVSTSDRVPDTERWPDWAARSLALGFRSAEAFPMRLHDRHIGVLSVYSRRQAHLSEQDRLVGQGLADMATIGLLHNRIAHDQQTLQEQLQSALDTRVAIEQAKGVLMERHRLAPEVAFERLRRHAREHGTKLRDVAALVAAGGLDP